MKKIFFFVTGVMALYLCTPQAVNNSASDSQKSVTASRESLLITTLDIVSGYYDISKINYENIDTSNIISAMESLQKACDKHMYIYADIWKMAISLTASKYIKNQNEILFPAKDLYREKGIDVLFNTKYDYIIQEIKKLDKNRYKSTIECYSIITDYKDTIENIQGSYNDYITKKSKLNSDFKRALSIAKVE